MLANRAQCPGIPIPPPRSGRRPAAPTRPLRSTHPRAQRRRIADVFACTFARIKEEVRKRSPIILNFSTGTIVDDVSEQCAYIRESTPEIAALNAGTMNYAKYSASVRTSCSTWCSPTPTRRSEAARGDERVGVKPDSNASTPATRMGCGHSSTWAAEASAPVFVRGQRVGWSTGTVESLQLKRRSCIRGRKSSGSRTATGVCSQRRWSWVGTSGPARIICIFRTARWRSRTRRWSRSPSSCVDPPVATRDSRAGARDPLARASPVKAKHASAYKTLLVSVDEKLRP